MAARLRLSPALIFLAFCLWALLITYPLGLHLFNHIPLGREPAGTVPLFNVWTLQWNIDQLVRGYPAYWDAPIFAPHAGTFAFSETQPLTALLASPLWLGLQSPAFGYNGVLLLFVVLNGWFTCWLLRGWGVAPLPALLAGLLMQSLPFVAQETGVLQLVALFGSLWTLLFLSRFLAQSKQDKVTTATFVGLVLGPPVTFFSCGYYGLFSLFFWPLALLFQFDQRHMSRRRVGLLLLAGLLAGLLCLPFLSSQRQALAQHNVSRSAATIERNSARLGDYLKVLDDNWWYGQVLGLESGSGQRLFPGLGLLLLAGLGLAGGSRRRIKGYLLLAVLLAFLLSLGLRLQPGPWQPYQYVRDIVPGFRWLRSPFRFAAMVQLHLALLAGFGLHNLQRRLLNRGRLAAGLVGGLLLLESLALPLPLHPVPNLAEPAPWHTWLTQREQPPRLVLLPFAASSRAADFEQTVRWMLETRHFQGQMLNGYSGFFPPGHAALRRQMLGFPSRPSVDFLRQRGVSYVIIHHRLANAPIANIVSQYLPRLYHDRQNDVSIYSVSP